MDILLFLASVNKISIIAFLVTLGLLIYEIYQLRKAARKQIKSKLPAFGEQKGAVFQPVIPPLPPEGSVAHMSVKKKNYRLLVVSLIGGVLSVGFIGFIGINAVSQNSRASQVVPEATAQMVRSVGVKVFNLNWQELSADQVAQLPRGSSIYVGIAAIPVADIDKARIRVNESSWRPEHETNLLSPDGKVYYKEYTIATSDARLQIDAQFHSVSQGWLGN